MASLVVGDVQGCRDALDRLCVAAGLRGPDRLLLVGDLVNRGPDNLGVLHRVTERGAEVVLGNHDLHLVARLLGVAGPPKRDDTLDDILGSPDRERWLAWLLEQPILRRVEEDLVVHAGLHPDWTLTEAEEQARWIEARLRRDPGPLVERRPALRPRGELRSQREALGVFTRIRTVDAHDRPEPSYTGPLLELPSHLRPWFRALRHELPVRRVFFGHWAALGHHVEGAFVGLDSGCVWGRSLTGYRREDGRTFQVPASLP